MKIINYIIVFFLLGSCQSKPVIQEKLFPYIFESKNETKFIGDSLKIEYVYRNDTVIQTRIDLKSSETNHFNNSFTVKSIWSIKNTSRLACKDKVSIEKSDLIFTFCYPKIIEKLDYLITNSNKDKPWLVDNYKEIKTEIINYKANKSESLRKFKRDFIYELIREINVNLYDNRSKSEIKKIQIEKYETSFSGGRKYYLLDNKNDTIALLKNNEWMR